MSRLPQNKTPKAIMLGMAFDSDGHKRVTTGENFALLGGSEETRDRSRTIRRPTDVNTLQQLGRTMATQPPSSVMQQMKNRSFNYLIELVVISI